MEREMDWPSRGSGCGGQLPPQRRHAKGRDYFSLGTVRVVVRGATKPVEIRPVSAGLAFARGAVPSRHGLIGVDWKRQPDQLSIKLDIPPGTQANVKLPTGQATNPQLLLEGRPLAPSTGGAGTGSSVHSIQREAGSIQFQLDPGHYRFTVLGL